MSDFDYNLSMMEYVPGISVGDVAKLVEMLQVDGADDVWPVLNNFLVDAEEVIIILGVEVLSSSGRW